MGNCIYSPGRTEGEGEGEYETRKKEGGGMTTVKLVLTKEELEWLMVQLKNRKVSEGKGKGLEEFLEEIERERSRRKSDQGFKFRPCLESISECSYEDLLLDA